MIRVHYIFSKYLVLILILPESNSCGQRDWRNIDQWDQILWLGPLNDAIATRLRVYQALQEPPLYVVHMDTKHSTHKSQVDCGEDKTVWLYAPTLWIGIWLSYHAAICVRGKATYAQLSS